jgi:hypothetical protein
VENGGERSKQEIELVDDGEVHSIHINAGTTSPETSGWGKTASSSEIRNTHDTG